MKNIAGQAVRGDNFFERPILLKQFQHKIQSGSSVLLSAPRRVGKTSLMFYMQDTGMRGYFFIYLITESVNSRNEFFKRIIHKIFDADFLTPLEKFSKKAARTIRDIAGRVNEIGTSIKLDRESAIDYHDEFVKLIKTTDWQDQTIVIMVDEFSQTVENIITDEGDTSAVRFLQINRELRQEPEINRSVRFVYSGSIGLENIVNRLNAIHLINDLDSLNVPPLNAAECHILIEKLTAVMPMKIGKGTRDYLLSRIEWYIPFYIQLAIQELNSLYYEKEAETGKSPRITRKMVDEAFERMLELRNCFEHWHTRLRKAFKGNEYTFAKELLNDITRNESITANRLNDLAVQLKTGEHYREIINALVYDGYISDSGEPKTYRFNSPLLRMWWFKNVAY